MQRDNRFWIYATAGLILAAGGLIVFLLNVRQGRVVPIIIGLLLFLVGLALLVYLFWASRGSADAPSDETEGEDGEGAGKHWPAGLKSALKGIGAGGAAASVLSQVEAAGDEGEVAPAPAPMPEPEPEPSLDPEEEAEAEVANLIARINARVDAEEAAAAEARAAAQAEARARVAASEEAAKGAAADAVAEAKAKVAAAVAEAGIAAPAYEPPAGVAPATPAGAGAAAVSRRAEAPLTEEQAKAPERVAGMRAGAKHAVIGEDLPATEGYAKFDAAADAAKDAAEEARAKAAAAVAAVIAATGKAAAKPSLGSLPTIDAVPAVDAAGAAEVHAAYAEAMTEEPVPAPAAAPAPAPAPTAAAATASTLAVEAAREEAYEEAVEAHAAYADAIGEPAVTPAAPAPAPVPTASAATASTRAADAMQAVAFAAAAEAAGSRARWIVKEYKHLTGDALLDAPVNALWGVSESDAALLADAFGIRTIRDLATNRFFAWAAEITAAADRE